MRKLRRSPPTAEGLHHKVEMGIHIKHVDNEQVQVIAPIRKQVLELKSGGDDLNLHL